MSGSVPLTIGGAFNGVTGVVTIPSSLLFGSSTVGGTINNLIQNYLTDVGNSVVGGTAAFSNTDLAGNSTVTAGGSGSASFQEFTNVDSTGASAAGSGSYPNASVTAGVTDLLVQTPGNVTLQGTGATTQAVFGAGSNVDYSVTNPAAGSIYLAGGADSVTLQYLSPGSLNAESIYSAGNDTMNLIGQGTDYVSVYGNGTVIDQDANAYVTAEGNATTNLFWENGNSGGSLHFTNNSSAAATINIGIFTVAGGGFIQAPTHVTASGGAGGGYFVGGTAGLNSLVGGSGAVTLVGAGNSDFLQANSAQQNVFFNGAGTETLEASSTTGANLFEAGLNYVGVGQPPAVGGIISTAGSGNQTFVLGNVTGESIVGSTASTAANAYFVVSDATAGGGSFSIYNFIDARSAIYLVDGAASGPGSASITGMGYDSIAGAYQIALSDHTLISLQGLSQSEMNAIHTGTLTGGITYIQG